MKNCYINVRHHPLAIQLQNNYTAILKEFESLRSAFPAYTKPNNIMGSVIDQGESNGKQLYTGRIRSIFTRVAEESCSEPEKIAVWGNTPESRLLAEHRSLERRAMTPVIESIIAPWGNYIGTVGFNIMEPGAKLSMHYGMIDKYIRFHLGLICDSGAQFHIGSLQPRSWEPGLVWAFDDGLAHHGTTHNGTAERVILLIDLAKEAFGPIEAE